MKRSELKVGEAYYYDRSNKFMEYGGGTKAVLVDDKRYAIRRTDWGWDRRKPRYSEDPKGTAVLVDIHRNYSYSDEGSVEREAVPVAHLRGFWEETAAAVEAAVKERREAEDTKRVERKAAQQRATAAQERATALGVPSTCESPYRISVPVDEFVKLLDALERAS